MNSVILLLSPCSIFIGIHSKNWSRRLLVDSQCQKRCWFVSIGGTRPALEQKVHPGFIRSFVCCNFSPTPNIRFRCLKWKKRKSGSHHPLWIFLNALRHLSVESLVSSLSSQRWQMPSSLREKAFCTCNRLRNGDVPVFLNTNSLKVGRLSFHSPKL